MTINKARGLKNVASYALYSLPCLVLNRETAENVKKPHKAISPTYFKHIISEQGSACFCGKVIANSVLLVPISNNGIGQTSS